MKIVKNKKLIEITRDELELAKYEKVIIDLGTGDGRFVYKNAEKNPNFLYIGIDPNQKQLEIYSQKSQKRKLTNVVFVLGSVEMLPTELKQVADELFIILPWGTLLQSIVKPTAESAPNISDILKSGGKLSILFGYDPAREPTEFARLELPEITEQHLSEVVVPAFGEIGLVKTALKPLTKEDLKTVESTWAKKLLFGKNRPMFLLSFEKRA